MTDSPPNVLQNEETRMREALGLRGSGAAPAAQSPPPQQQQRDHDRRRRRFVQDGEVPVVVLSPNREHGADSGGSTNRFEVAERALRTERSARERAERSLSDTNATLQNLRTKLAHAELAHGEALAAERAGREAAEAALTDATAGRAELEERLRALEAERDHAIEASRVARLAAPEPQAVAEARPDAARGPVLRRPIVRRALAPAEPEGAEPEPVKWWLPSYRAKTRRK